MQVGDRSLLVEPRHVRLGNGGGQVAAALGHPDVGMAEQVADDEERRPAHDKVARVGVAQRVRAERQHSRASGDTVEAVGQVVPVVLRPVGARKHVRT